MIKSWKHKGLKRFSETGSTTGIQNSHQKPLKIILERLNAAVQEDLDLPGMHFHQLIGKQKDYYSVKENSNWRVIFQFEGTDAVLVDYLDYH